MHTKVIYPSEPSGGLPKIRDAVFILIQMAPQLSNAVAEFLVSSGLDVPESLLNLPICEFLDAEYGERLRVSYRIQGLYSYPVHQNAMASRPVTFLGVLSYVVDDSGAVSDIQISQPLGALG